MGAAGQIWHIVRAIIGFGTLTMTVVAARLLPIGNVQAILACNGLLVLGWIILRGNEPLRMPVVVGTFLCVAGAVLSSEIDLNQRSMAGYAAAVSASVCWAAEILVFRHAVVRSAGKTSLLFINIIGVLLLIIPASLRWRHVETGELCVLLSVGVLLVGAQAALIQALELVPLSTTIPFRYLNVPIALCLGLAVLHQIPSLEAIAGALLIMIGGTALSRYLSSIK